MRSSSAGPFLLQAPHYRIDVTPFRRIVVWAESSLPGDDPMTVTGHPNGLELLSSTTLFAQISGQDFIFHQVIDKYYGASSDKRAPTNAREIAALAPCVVYRLWKHLFVKRDTAPITEPCFSKSIWSYHMTSPAYPHFSRMCDMMTNISTKICLEEQTMSKGYSPEGAEADQPTRSHGQFVSQHGSMRVQPSDTRPPLFMR